MEKEKISIDKEKLSSEKLNFWQTNHSHNFSWHETAAGYWFRYPNQHSKHVFSVDTLETRIEGGKLYTRRLIVKTNSLPSWGKHFFPDARVPVIEESIVDPSGHKLIWYTRNIGLVKFMSTVEKATLTQSKQSHDQTDVLKQVWIGSSILGFRSAIRKFGIDRYKKNCILATQGFETVLENTFGAPDKRSTVKQVKETPSIDLSEYCPVSKNPPTDAGHGGKKSSADFGNKSADISFSSFPIGNKQKNQL